MSPEKMQLLLLKLTSIRELARECAAAMGMPDRLIMLPFAPVAQHPADLLMELAKDGPRNPGVLKFVTEHMPDVKVSIREPHSNVTAKKTREAKGVKVGRGASA